MKGCFLASVLFIFSFSGYSQGVCNQLGFETEIPFHNWSGYINNTQGNCLQWRDTVCISRRGVYQSDPRSWTGNKVLNLNTHSVITETDPVVRFNLIHKDSVIRNGDTLVDGPTNIIKLISPAESNYILQLGNSNRNDHSEKITFSFVVTEETQYISYYYALVLEDPSNHTSGFPYFYAEAKHNEELIECEER